jgi:colanic acid/amylovoran biosynthesis glycosyltransferase
LSNDLISVLTIAYLANQFPVTVEPYVGDEIGELHGRGVKVLPGSVRAADAAANAGSAQRDSDRELLHLQPLRATILLRALRLAVRRRRRISGLMGRVLLRGKESSGQRVKAMLHTLLGAYYAVLLQDRGVDHIHVHHGYFGSWIAMVAARLLDTSFSLTLHGSDLLIDGAYLHTKLSYCEFCITISEYNRRYLLQHFPSLDARKVVVSRLGVDVPPRVEIRREAVTCAPRTFSLLSVGRLHAVKDHAFLIRACEQLRDRGLSIQCLIAGEGTERRRLEAMIRETGLQERLTLVGHACREQIELLFATADLVVLTSRSEGIPLVLMEAMARGKLVLAPAITGIPELVIPGKTGFLYAPGVLDDFIAKILFVERLMSAEAYGAVSKLDWVRHAARNQVLRNFNRKKNLAEFGDRFLRLVGNNGSAKEGLAHEVSAFRDRSSSHEDLVLQ